MSAVGMMGLTFLFPIIYLILSFTDALVYLYNPLLRIGTIIVICGFYFWYATHKKYTKRQNDFLEDLSLISGHVNGIEYFYTANHNQKITSIITWIEGIYGYDFSLKFEGKFERFFKSFGFNAECQTGEKRFDEMVYIVSDDEWLCQELKRNEALRKTIYDIFWCYSAYHFKITKIVCFDGRLMVSATLKYEKEIESLDESLANSFTKTLVPLMQNMIAYLPSKQTIDGKLYREQTNYIAFSFYVLIVALIVNGSMILFADIQYHSMLVSSFAILPLSFKITAITFTIIFSLAWILLRKSSRFVPFLLVLLTSGVFGIFTTSLAEIKEINFFFDDTLADAIPTQIYKKEIRTGKHGTQYYYILLNAWRNSHKPYKMQIADTFYNKVATGDHVIVFEHKGFLGYPWIEDIKLSQKYH